MRKHSCATTLQARSPSVLSKLWRLPLLHAFPLFYWWEWRHPGQCALLVITRFTPPPHPTPYHPQIQEPAISHFSVLLELRIYLPPGAEQCEISCALICFAWFYLFSPPREFPPPPKQPRQTHFHSCVFPTSGCEAVRPNNWQRKPSLQGQLLCKGVTRFFWR